MGQCCVWRNVKTRALRRRSRLHNSDVHGRTYMDVSPLAERNTSAPGPPLPVVARHAADRATARRALAPLSLSLSLSRCTGTRRMKLQPWRAFKSGTGPSQLAIVVDYFGLVTTVCTSLHQSAPACTTHAGDSRGPESSSRGPAHMWRLFVDPQSHRLPLVVAVQPALPLLLRILLLSASCTLAGHAASPIASSPARAASTSAPEGGGARPGSHTPTVS